MSDIKTINILPNELLDNILYIVGREWVCLLKCVNRKWWHIVKSISERYMFKLYIPIPYTHIYNSINLLSWTLNTQNSYYYVIQRYKENIRYLARAGFNDVTSIQKFLCFEGFLAIK